MLESMASRKRALRRWRAETVSGHGFHPGKEAARDADCCAVGAKAKLFSELSDYRGQDLAVRLVWGGFGPLLEISV